MRNLDSGNGGATSSARRAGDSTAHRAGLCGLGVALCLAFPTPSHAQAATASREDRPTLNRTKDMTALNTTDAAPTTPASRTTEDDVSIRPFRFHASDEALTDLRRRVRATK